MLKAILALPILFISLFSLAGTNSKDCSWDPKIKFTANLYEVIEVDDLSLLTNMHSANSELVNKYQEHYRNQTDINQIALRKRQHAIFKKHFKNDEPSVQMMQIILDNKLGKTRTSNCLEMLLHERHLLRVGIKDETEFGAHVLLHPNKGLRILFQSSDDATVPVSTYLYPDLKAALAEGFVLMTHIHIHPFIMSNPSGDIGGVNWPSGPGLDFGDLSVYVNLHSQYGLREARVTNGFDTFTLSPKEFVFLKNLKPNQK